MGGIDERASERARRIYFGRSSYKCNYSTNKTGPHAHTRALALNFSALDAASPPHSFPGALETLLLLNSLLQLKIALLALQPSAFENTKNDCLFFAAQFLLLNLFLSKLTFFHALAVIIFKIAK